MTVVHFEPYQVTLHPGANVDVAAKRLANYIVDTWMPGNAGGATFIMVPQLMQLLTPLYEKARVTNKDVRLDIRLVKNRPYITEVPT